MHHKQKQEPTVLVFKHFSRKPYALFGCLKKEVRVGVLGVLTLTFAHSGAVIAQNNTTHDTTSEDKTPEVLLDEVNITGSLAPLTGTQSARIITVLTRQEIEHSAAHSVNDLLKLAVGVDVRQRGGFGVQTDISLDGGTFDQVTVLLNGVNINNPQTGHLTADFPVSVEDIERIEVLEGAASRVYGSSAFGGAINIVTRHDKRNNVEVGLKGGSYGTFGTHVATSISNDRFNNRLSANFLRSDGGTTNSAFRSGNLFYQGAYSADAVRISWQTGYTGKGYGANTFYSGAFPNQYESNDRYFVAVKAETGKKIHFLPTIFWNRSFDHFQLVHNTSYGENHHRTDVFGANISVYFNWICGRTSFGAEMRNEGILSTNLGRKLADNQLVRVPRTDSLYYNHHDNRTNISYFAEHNIIWHHTTISLGVMANQNSAMDTKFHFYPGIDVSYRPNDTWKVFASWDKAFRMPTFTDLYYKSPTQDGNVGLKAEETQSFLGGLKFMQSWIELTANGFFHKEKNMIDWVMYTASDIYHATSFKLDNMGYSLQANVNPQALWGQSFPIERFYAGYTYIHQKRHDNTEIFKSNYALEYLRHKIVLQLDHRIISHLSASWSFRWQDRMGSYLRYENGKSTGEKVDYKPYGILDLKLLWSKHNYQFYAEANNLTNRRFYDLGNVRQPGVWFMVGGNWKIDF